MVAKPTATTKKVTPREKGQTKRSVVHHACRARAHKLNKRGKWIVVVDAGSFAWTEIIKGGKKVKKNTKDKR